MPSITLQPGETAADYANPRAITPDDLRRQGFRFVARYINGSTHHWKVLTHDERDRLLAAGLGLVLVFEKSADRWRGGVIAGATDGAQAEADAARLGYPDWGVIVPAFDSDVTKKTLPLAVEYWHAFNKACKHPTGAYGDWDVIDAVAPWSACNWQANAGGWSWLRLGRKWLKRTHPQAHMLQQRQRDGIDPNVCLRPFEVWAGHDGGPAPAPGWDPEHGVFGLWPLNTNKPEIRRGDDSDAVRYLQGVILTKGGGRIEVDGVFDVPTEERVKDLQRMFHLPETGVVDLATWKVVDFLVVS